MGNSECKHKRIVCDTCGAEHICRRADRIKPNVKLDDLLNYVVHDGKCLCSQWRQGRPTESGGYETLYGYGENEKWYPLGEEPPCSCGLNDIIDACRRAYEEAGGKK